MEFKIDTNEHIYKTDTQRTDFRSVRGRWGGGGKDCAFGISGCKLSWINNKVLLYIAYCLVAKSCLTLCHPMDCC